MASLKDDLLTAARLVEERDCTISDALAAAPGVIEGARWMARVGTLQRALEQHLGMPVALWDSEPDVTWMHRAAALRAAAKKAGPPTAVPGQPWPDSRDGGR